MDHNQHGMGRIKPQDNEHIRKYGISLTTSPAEAERVIAIPKGFKAFYNQTRYNGCVGWSLSMLMALLNTNAGKPFRKYDAPWLWGQAKLVDGIPSTNPGDNNGTTVRAGFDVLRDKGPVRLNQRTGDPMKRGEKPVAGDGITQNEWLTSVEDMRTVAAESVLLEMGTAWTSSMMDPVQVDGQWRLPKAATPGRNDGGHAYLICGVSDKLGGFLVPNSWGDYWPDPRGGATFAVLPYSLMENLLADDGECGFVSLRD